MDQTLEVINMNTKSTELNSSKQLKISPEMQSNFIKQESDYCIQSENHIKAEPQEDENQFLVLASTLYEMCPNYNMKIEIDEPVIKFECESMIDKLMQDPLDVSSEIKDEEQFPIDFDHGELKIKTESTGREKVENILESDVVESHGSDTNQVQDQLLIKNDSGHKDKKHICHICNKMFTQKWSLDRHLRVHTGEKPFSCNVCEKAFNTQDNLDRHMLIHSGKKTHFCNVCKKDFSLKSNLNTHKLIHSGEKPFSCNECDKSFTQKANLTRHKLIHTGEKPFVCNLCDKAFTQESHLTEHRRVHTGNKPYSCSICNESFAQRAGLNQHKRTHKH